MTVVLLTTDLMTMSRIDGAASRSGVRLQIASSAQQAATLCRLNSAGLLIVDLSSPSLDLSELVAAVKACDAAPKIIAFGPHVHEDRLAAARDAGCDEVISRGQFFGQMDDLLRS